MHTRLIRSWRELGMERMMRWMVTCSIMWVDRTVIGDAENAVRRCRIATASAMVPWCILAQIRLHVQPG
jgi:hypothetical protein